MLALCSVVLMSYFAQNYAGIKFSCLNHGQSNSSMATTRTENTHGPTYPVARAIDITEWQSVDTLCLCCLTHGVCVSHWTPPSSHNSAMEFLARYANNIMGGAWLSMTQLQLQYGTQTIKWVGHDCPWHIRYANNKMGGAWLSMIQLPNRLVWVWPLRKMGDYSL